MIEYGITKSVLESMARPKELQSDVDGGYVLRETPEGPQQAAVHEQLHLTFEQHITSTTNITETSNKEPTTHG